MKRFLRTTILWLTLGIAGNAAAFNKIIVPEQAHPALPAAARIIARKLGLPDTAIQTGAPAAGAIVLKVVENQPGLKHDGYTIRFENGGATICGARPRSLLFAAGDVHLWQAMTSGTLVRDPAFARRAAEFHGRLSVPEYVAVLGVNMVIGRRIDREGRFARACREADVEFYALLYGNDYARWSASKYAAAVKVNPTAKGVPAPATWERASLCPSDPATWRLIEAYVKDFAATAKCDGVYATFWDEYGLNCQCTRCVKNGLNKFPNQLYECVKHYHAALAPTGQKLVVRTWSSGIPHWLRDQWVTAPGDGNFSGTATDIWARVINELPPSIVIQTKVYNSDCQPDPPFSPLLGHAAPHPEMAEWQITGQTTGRFYFPASTVNHTAWTMQKSLALVGATGGVCLFPGGTRQGPHYDLLADIANSINVYAWRELSWNPDADVDKVWMDWATQIYGAKAARHVVNALKLSEPAVNRTFSALGLGTDTNSGFPSTIARREVLLKYTNRYYLPEGQKNLAPTLENVQRVIAEKDDCLKQITEMLRELELAKPDLTKAQADELTTRFNWLREFAITARALDESLWRYRYLRHLSEMLTTDPEQMEFLAKAYDTVQSQRTRLFRFDPAQRFSGYDVPLGNLDAKPSLGSPVGLMHELYDASRQSVEATVGPNYLPAEWRRGAARPAKPKTATTGEEDEF